MMYRLCFVIGCMEWLVQQDMQVHHMTADSTHTLVGGVSSVKLKLKFKLKFRESRAPSIHPSLWRSPVVLAGASIRFVLAALNVHVPKLHLGVLGHSKHNVCVVGLKHKSKSQHTTHTLFWQHITKEGGKNRKESQSSKVSPCRKCLRTDTSDHSRDPCQKCCVSLSVIDP